MSKQTRVVRINHVFSLCSVLVVLFNCAGIFCYLQAIPNKDTEANMLLLPNVWSIQNKSNILSTNRHYDSNLGHLSGVVQMLLPPEKANEYFLKILSNFKFYVYTNLSHPFTWQGVSKTRENERQCFGDNMTRETFLSTYCDWASSICNPTNHTRTCQYSTGRHNRNGDTLLSKLLTEYQGPLRTHDPHVAQLFVVPYPAAGYESTSVRGRKNSFLSPEMFQSEILGRLEFFNDSTVHSHLFLFSGHRTRSGIQSMPLVASISQRRASGHIVIPYVNTHAEYQPPTLLERTAQFYKDKNVSLAAVMASKISGNGWVRRQFFDTIANISTIGGLAVSATHVQEKRKLLNELEVMHLYRQSIFCPCFRGDEPAQKRFFDAILSGCIPVVMAYTWSTKDGTLRNMTSYFVPGDMPNSKFLPFAKGSFEGEPEMGIDYSELVVEINGSCGMPCLIPTLEELLHDKEKLHRKQMQLNEYAKLFSYGMQGNAFQFVDAITAILVHAHHSSMENLLHSRASI